jgi:hypothetical protein
MINLGAFVIKRIYARAQNLVPGAGEKTAILRLRLQNSGLLTPAERASRKIPDFTAEDVQLMNCLRQELNDELGPEHTISDREVLFLALQELQLALRSSQREDKVLRLQFHLWDANRNKNQ